MKKATTSSRRKSTSAGPSVSEKADETLRSFAASRGPAEIDPEIAIAEALHAAGGHAPDGFVQLTFANPRIGLDDSRMRTFLQNLATLFDTRIAARILHDIAPVAAQRVGLLRDLIRLWQTNLGT